MGFQEISNKGLDITEHKDKPFIGFYIKTRVVESDYGDQEVHDFESDNANSKGELITIYGFGMLNKRMQAVAPGSYCRITYLGTQQIDKGRFKGKDAHTVKVEVDASRAKTFRTLDEVGAPAGTPPNGTGKQSDPNDDLPF